MNNFVLRELPAQGIESELAQIGFDVAYRHVASNKFRYKNIKIYSLSVAQANILKQTALIFGADCAVHKDVITGKAEKSDVILCGSYSQLTKIAEKLATQPFKLAILGREIKEFLTPQTRQTQLVGILNVTPDSFSDGGMYFDPKSASNHLIELIKDGADIIDIGAESTKPYSQAVSAGEQIERLAPILDFAQKENLKIPISVDTRSAKVAEFVLENGASIINDVSGFDFDPKIAEVIAKYSAKVIIQHSQGTPDIMQIEPKYNNLIEEIYFHLKNKIEFAREKGICDIIIDPGIGFGKTREDNLTIINRVEEFYSLNCPIMLGISRKSFLGVKDENNDLKDALSLAISYPAVQKGVDYLRVHNVKLHKNLLNF